MVRPATAQRPPIRSVPEEYAKLRPFGDDVLREIMALRKRLTTLETQVAEGGSDEGGGAPNDAQYIVAALDPTLTAERVLTEGNAIDITLAAGTATVAVDESELTMAGAPVVTTAATGSFSAESVLTEGPGIDITVGGGLATVSLDPTTIAPVTIYTVNFSTLANNTLTSGTESIDGHNYTVANSANATLFEILNGSGLHFDASTNNNAFATGTQTAPYATVTWTDLLGANFDPLGTYIVEIYVSSRTMTVNNNKFCFGVLTESALGFADLGMATIIRTGGATIARHEAAGGSTSTGVSGFTGDTLHLVISANLVRSYGGTFAAGFPAPSAWTFLGQSTCGTGANADQSSFLSPSARLAYAFATGETGGTMDVVVQQKRVRRFL